MDIPPSEPAAEPESTRENRNQPGKTGTQRPAKRLWKRRSLRELGNPFGIPTFPQPQQQQTFSGYISNGATWIARVTFSNGLTRSAPSSRWHTLNKWNVLGSRHGFPGGRVLSFPPSLAGAPGAGGVYPDRVAAHAVFGLSSIFLRRHPTLFRKSIGPQLPQALSIDGLAPHCAPLATSIYPRNVDRIRREQAAGGKLVANEVGGG